MVMKPKYAAVYESLLATIATLQPGAKLDSELELSRKMDVAPMTVRRALTLLAQEGRTVGIPGKGTFVAAPPPEKTREPLPSLEDHLRTRLDTELIGCALQRASSAQREAFGLDAGEFVYLIRQLRTGPGVRGVEETHIDAKHFPDLLSEDLSRPVRDCLENAYGYHLTTTQLTLAHGTASADDAEVLEVEPGSGVLCLSWVSGDDSGKTLLRTRGVFAGELRLEAC